MKIERAIVTGGAGFIGSHLADELIKMKCDVMCIDNMRSGLESNFIHHIDNDHSNYRIIFKDIQDPTVRNLFKEFKPTHVFHLAAIPGVAYSVSNIRETDETNINGTANLLELSREFEVQRFIFSSSSSVYGGSEVLPTPEDIALNPKSPYAMQKMVGEQYCKLFSEQYELETVALRYFNIFGPRQYGWSPYAAVIAAFADSIKNGTTPKIHGDGEQFRDFCIVDGAKVLMSDLSYRNIEELKEGDFVLSFYEKPINNKRKFKIGKVSKTFRYLSSNVYKVTFEDNSSIECTGEHPWLTSKGFRTTESFYKRLNEGKNILDVKSLSLKNEKTFVDNINYKEGYVLGSLDSDGYLSKYEYINGKQFSSGLEVTDLEFAEFFYKSCADLNINLIKSTYQPKYKNSKLVYRMISNKGSIYNSLKEMHLSIDDKLLNMDFCRGYMAAIFDGKGENDRQNLRISNTDQRIIDNIKKILEKFNFKYSILDKTSTVKYISILGGLMETFRFYSIFNYKISRKKPKFEDREVKTYKKKIISLEKIKPKYVNSIEIDNYHTFIVNNLLSHNTYIDNVVSANIKAALAEKPMLGEVFNVGCGGRFTVNDLHRIMNCSLAKYTESRPGDVKCSQADISKAKEMLGYEVKVSFEDGIKKTIEWYLNIKETY